MFEQILNLVFPPKCIFCKKILNIGAKLYICEDCCTKIPYMKNGNIKLIKASNYYDDIICVCEYSGIIKEALIRYKFFNKPSYYRTFAQLLYNKINEMTEWEKVDIIISVPLYRKKERQRGYNQSHLISKHLGKLLGIKVDGSLIIRTKNTDSQSLLNRVERLQNVKDAFQVTDAKAVYGKSILILDDIFTTGTTLNECCKVLKNSGARKITAAVIATGRKF
jgi:ComF family protein